MTHQDYQNCIDACLQCIVECSRCATACLGEEDAHMLVRCIKLDQDCAAICTLAVQAMARDSEFAKEICNLCADVCNTCADECEKHAHMQHCAACAAVCRICAEECSAMNLM